MAQRHMSDSRDLPNDTTKALRIPTPPRFSDFKFSTIGQQPNLLKRMTSPVVPGEGEEFVEDPPESLSSGATAETVVNKFRSRPSLLEVLASDDVTMEEFAGDSDQTMTGRNDSNNKATAETSGPHKTSQNSRVLPPHLSTSVSQLVLNSLHTPHTPSHSSNQVKMTYHRSQEPQSPSISRPSSMAYDCIGEPFILPDDEPPTLATLRALHAKVTALLADLSPVDNVEALALSQSLKDQCSTVLTAARNAHNLAKRASAAAQESMNVAQECLAAAESIQPRVCEVLEAIHKVGPHAEDSGPTSDWNSSLQTLKVLLHHIDQWASRKEAYDVLQKEESVLDSVTMQKQEIGTRSTSRISPSPSIELSKTSAEQESAERKRVQIREKVAERQRLAEEDLRRRREDEERLERDLQEARDEANARAEKLALLKAERQRAEEEEREKQKYEAWETQERELALENARQSGRAKLVEQKKKETNRTSDSPKVAMLGHKGKQKAPDDEHGQADTESAKRRQSEGGAPRRQENEAKKRRQVAATGDAVDPKVLQQSQLETPKRRVLEIETGRRRAAEGTTAMRQATEQRPQSEIAQQREVETEAARRQAAVVAEQAKATDEKCQQANIGVAKKRQVGTEVAEHRQAEGPDVPGQHAETVRQEQAEAGVCRRQVEIESAKPHQPDVNDQRNEGAMEFQKLDEAQEPHSPLRVPTTTPLSGSVLPTTRNSSCGTSSTVDPTPIPPTSPIANNVIGNLTSRKTLVDRYKQNLISPKEKKHQISVEPVTATQRRTPDPFTAHGLYGTNTGPSPSIVVGSMQQHDSPNTSSVLSKPDDGIHQLTESLDKDLRPVELQPVSDTGESLVNLSQATSTSPPPNDTSPLGNVILLRTRLVPTSPVAQKVIRGRNGLPNPLFIKAEPVAQKADPKSHEGGASLPTAIPSALRAAASSEGVSLTSKPAAVQNKENICQAKPTPIVADQSSLDVALPKVKPSEDVAPPVSKDVSTRMSKPSIAAPPLPSTVAAIPNVPRRSPSPVSTSRHTTVTPIARSGLQTPPACIAGFFPQFQQGTFETRVTAHPHVAKTAVAPTCSRPMSQSASITSNTSQASHERRHTPLPNGAQSSPRTPGQVLRQPSLRPRSDVHDPFDSRMGPDLMTPSAWDGAQDDEYNHRRLPTGHRHDHYTPSPTPLPKPRQRSPRPTQVVSRNGYNPPGYRGRGPPAHRGKSTRSRSWDISSRRPFRSPDPDRVPYDLRDQHAPPPMGRKRSRDEDEVPGPPPRRPRRSDHRQNALPDQRMSSSSTPLVPTSLASEPSTSTVYSHPELASLATRVDVSRPTEVPNLGNVQARATPLMQRMDHHSIEPTNHIREQYSPNRHSPLHPLNNDGPSYFDHTRDYYPPDLLNRISEPTYSQYPGHHMSGYHRHPHSNPNRRFANRSRPPRSGSRGRGGAFQHRGHPQQALINRLQAPSNYPGN